MAAKYRYFPWLGIRKLDSEDVHNFALPRAYKYSALMFEWLDWQVLLVSRATLKEKDGSS